jgi:chorismate mutase
MTTESNLEQIERLRERTRHNEASALGHAKRVARKEREAEILKRLRELGVADDIIEKALNGVI